MCKGLSLVTAVFIPKVQPQDSINTSAQMTI